MSYLVQLTPGVAIPFPTRRYGELHKHFGISDDENGNPVAYARAMSVTAGTRAKETLAAARIGGTVIYKGKRYTIRLTANHNIALDLI